MTRFSIVVPAFKVQGYLRECLDSVLQQSFTDFELIAVDDCSPDRCGAIIDEYAARDGRVRAVHLPRNVGLGPARNAGIEHAAGEYLLFLDSDDTYTPGTLAALDRKLARTDEPEVLVFDYARTFWWGGMRRNIMHRVLTDAGTGTFTAAERPEILDLLMVVWNKAYRRDFVAEHGFRFPPGYYEDTPWTFPVMVTAERIAALDRICVLYRQRHQGNILGTTSRKHFDIFAQYQRVIEHMRERDGLRQWLPYIHHRMGEHCLQILGNRRRLPEEDRKEFYRRAALAYRRRPAGSPGTARSDRAGLLLLDRAPYGAYLLDRRLRAAQRTAKKRIRGVRRTAWRSVRSASVKALSLLPPDPGLAVYSSFHHRRPAGDPWAIHEQARRSAPGLRGVWVVRRADARGLPPGVDHVVPNSLRYWWTVTRASYFVNNVNWAHGVVKRRGQVHIHTHQGTPLKHMGLDLRDHPAAAHRTDIPAMLRRSDRWDASLVGNRHSEDVWDRAYPCRFTSLRSGSPRNDVLVNAGPGEASAARERLGIPGHHTVVLYAPTDRNNRKSFVPHLDPEALAGALGPDATLLIRLHWRYAKDPYRELVLRDPAERGLLRDATDEPSVEELMLASDALITDYSSLMFDYANLDRPIVVHADDWETYRVSRGTYFDLTASPPGPVSTTTEELISLFSTGAWCDENAERLRAAFRDRFCEFEDGHAAERVVQRFFPVALRAPARADDGAPAGRSTVPARRS